jgi:hypothetical protein
MKTFKQFINEQQRLPFDMYEHGHDRVIPFDMYEHGHDRHDRYELHEGLISKWASESGSPIDETHPELQKHHSENFNRDDNDAIGHYVMGGLYAQQSTGSGSLNRHLLKTHTDNQPSPSSSTIPGESGRSDVHFDLNKLDTALNINKLKEPLTTYTGLKHNPTPQSSDGVTHLPVYTSSSPNRHVALKYAPAINGIRHIIKIDHGIGHTGAYIGNNPAITPFHDDEFIIPRHSHIKINPVPEEHENAYGDKFHIWHAKRLT